MAREMTEGRLVVGGQNGTVGRNRAGGDSSTTSGMCGRRRARTVQNKNLRLLSFIQKILREKMQSRIKQIERDRERSKGKGKEEEKRSKDGGETRWILKRKMS